MWRAGEQIDEQTVYCVLRDSVTFLLDWRGSKELGDIKRKRNTRKPSAFDAARRYNLGDVQSPGEREDLILRVKGEVLYGLSLRDIFLALFVDTCQEPRWNA